MIALLALLVQVAPLAPPQDWSTLPILRVRRAATDLPDLSTFVRAEVDAGRCAAATVSPQGTVLKLDLAVLATPEGQVRRITPRAINCPTVEQYAAGLVLGSTRDNVDVRGGLADTWYRTTMTFAWSQ